MVSHYKPTGIDEKKAVSLIVKSKSSNKKYSDKYLTDGHIVFNTRNFSKDYDDYSGLTYDPAKVNEVVINVIPKETTEFHRIDCVFKTKDYDIVLYKTEYNAVIIIDYKYAKYLPEKVYANFSDVMKLVTDKPCCGFKVGTMRLRPDTFRPLLEQINPNFVA